MSNNNAKSRLGKSRSFAETTEREPQEEEPPPRIILGKSLADTRFYCCSSARDHNPPSAQLAAKEQGTDPNGGISRRQFADRELSGPLLQLRVWSSVKRGSTRLPGLKGGPRGPSPGTCTRSAVVPGNRGCPGQSQAARLLGISYIRQELHSHRNQRVRPVDRGRGTAILEGLVIG